MTCCDIILLTAQCQTVDWEAHKLFFILLLQWYCEGGGGRITLYIRHSAESSIIRKATALKIHTNILYHYSDKLGVHGKKQVCFISHSTPSKMNTSPCNVKTITP